jgi:Recombination endonuclease VII
MSKDSSAKRGHRGFCKSCAAKKVAGCRAKDPEKYRASVRGYAQQRKYGADGIQHFAEQKKMQEGKCAICHQPMTKMCSDHNHETGRWRGVLCNSCNGGIGLLKDSIETLESAIAYLKRWA